LVDSNRSRNEFANFDYAEELKELVEEIQNQAFRLEDKWWYCKNEAGK
jgi:hypothetical protein